MTVLTREVLESSSLADLHALAGELAVDGFRKLRREQLVDTILERRGGAGDDEEQGGRRRRRRGGRRDEASSEATTISVPVAGDDEGDERPARRRRRRGGEDAETDAPREHGRSDRDRSDRDRSDEAETEGTVEGVLAITSNGSAMLKADDGTEVYVSAGQVRRCELVDGDRVGGPTRSPRRSERYPSLVRVETINGRAADETSTGTRFEELAAVRPTELLAIESEDPTVAAIAYLTPLGRGSRAVVVGPHAAGKTEALRRLAVALRGIDGLELLPVLAGVRPEELADWTDAGLQPAVALDLTAGPDARAKAIDEVVERGRRIAARGGHAVLLIDTLDGLGDGAARRILAAARKLRDGGSLTIVATRETPAGGESTVVRLDAALTATRRFPALDLAGSGTLRPETLVGEDGAAAIAKARAELA
ncbi:Rho termination factor N-terminal domain-containing protein [Patulibacter sp. SYSU D01012]|uniref:Rho termination factor N-terminal domain-containing protein n=1 Tax=Patulibacter sp. SYSU D01012 TaxID=2817381 RepID=UPI001B30B72B|nr:Rho termination factor N-terminal domain-containing protein [Patulibacter sp. SYSU D01012]